MRPDGVPAVHPAGVAQRRPELQHHASGAAATQVPPAWRTSPRPDLRWHEPGARSRPGGRGGHPLSCRLGDDLVHPSLDKRQHGFQSLQGRQLLRRLLQFEQATFEAMKSDPRSCWHRAGRRPAPTSVYRDATRVLLNQSQHLRSQPASRGEESLPSTPRKAR